MEKLKEHALEVLLWVLCLSIVAVLAWGASCVISGVP